MRYPTPQALRQALEHKLLARATETGVSIDRLRRRVLFERVIARLAAAEPDRWVLKGGMALEVRLSDDARLTKDIDLGLRDSIEGAEDLHERLIEALTADPDDDGFVLAVTRPERLGHDGGGHLTWRAKVAARLADKPFGSVQLDVSPRSHELDATDRLTLPNSLEFAEVPATQAEIIDIHRHAAEKFHALCRDFGDRENSRVRDLVDLAILIEHGLLTPRLVANASDRVWAEREQDSPPSTLPMLPVSWPDRYERIATEHDLPITTFAAAVNSVSALWAEMFPAEEN